MQMYKLKWMLSRKAKQTGPHDKRQDGGEENKGEKRSRLRTDHRKIFTPPSAHGAYATRYPQSRLQFSRPDDWARMKNSTGNLRTQFDGDFEVPAQTQSQQLLSSLSLSSSFRLRLDLCVWSVYSRGSRRHDAERWGCFKLQEVTTLRWD